MPSLEVLCGPEEFWDKIRETVQKLGLVCFKRYQRDNRVVPVSISELGQPLEWQWDFWIAKKLPDSQFSSDLPAKAGWILVREPVVGPEKRISRGEIAAKAEWLDRTDGVIKQNNDLKRLFTDVRRVFNKGTVTSIGEVVFSENISRKARFRYTNAALELQRSGWLFVTDTPGAILKIL